MMAIQTISAVWLLALLCLASNSFTTAMPTAQYMEARDTLLSEDRKNNLGQSLLMTPLEEKVSDFLVKSKKQMIEDSRIGGKVYYPSLSFYQSKPLVDDSAIFKVIRRMPKGAALHLHDMSATSIDWLVSNVTYRNDLFMCVDRNTSLMIFRFFRTPPVNPDCPWISVRQARENSLSKEQFDLSIKQNLSLLATDPLVNYPSLTKVWTRFSNFFLQVMGMIFYRPVLGDYFKQSLVEFYQDKVQYIELRCLLSGIYDLNGKDYSHKEVLQLFTEVATQFTKDNPDFFGAKFVFSSLRNLPKQDIGNMVNLAIELRQKFPNTMLGYDLVGQEDPYNPLIYYKDQLLSPQQRNPPVNLPYFFHAAETNWQGTATDYNLIDAILLNTTRIGHGFGLIKHKKLVDLVKEKGIAVEVNPISNQILGLVKDLRNHGMIPLLQDDFPVVISSDDPSTWEASPLSHDYYMAFMNMCGEDADLRFLKQLAINSIKYSAMSPKEKDDAMTKWNIQWNKFIIDTVKWLGNCDSSLRFTSSRDVSHGHDKPDICVINNL